MWYAKKETQNLKLEIFESCLFAYFNIHPAKVNSIEIAT